MVFALRNGLAMLVIFLGAVCVSSGYSWAWWPMDQMYFSLFVCVIAAVASAIGTVNGVIWYPVWLLCIVAIQACTNPDDPEFVLGIAIHANAALPMILIGWVSNCIKRAENCMRI
jgi:hypothetical protein